MPERTRLNEANCSLARALDAVGDWWTLLIVRDAAMGIQRFSDFRNSLGIARNILTDRLRRLCSAGVMQRGPNGFYELTHKGWDLLVPIVALTQWGDRWQFDNGPPVIIETRSRRPIRTMQLTDDSGAAVSPADLVFSAGPGATDATRTFLGG